jgi:hypothetical protein
MAAHVVKVSPAHNPSFRRRRWPLRLLGLLATVAFLGSGAAIATMVIPDSNTRAAAEAPTRPHKAKAAHKGHPALTKAQKRQRAAALGALRSDGYQPARLADWRPKAGLQVLIGRNEQGAMRAYFFIRGKFIAHDDAATSNNIRVAKQGQDSVTLSYRLSTGGRQSVTFQLQDGAVEPTTPVPPLSVR